ncbi:MAG: hypothetical protein ABSF61_14045 [Anaerolineales bacterium]|jgi:hypothetical protein
MSLESAVRQVIARMDSTWSSKRLDGLETCFHESALIVGPGYFEYARGRE